MADQNQQEDYFNSFVSSINTKLRDIEEKQSIIKDRVILIGTNLISERDKVDEEISEMKKNLLDVTNDLKRIKLMLNGLTETNSNFAKRTELEILERQFKMFQPLELVRVSDVENIVRKVLDTRENKKQQN
jgi:DNA-binding transcriptional regulator GbsR (MarR family)